MTHSGTTTAARPVEPEYRIVLTAAPGTENGIRSIIGRSHGDLRSFARRARRGACGCELRLGARRIDDIVTALEAAGYAVDAVVGTATCHGCPSCGARRGLRTRMAVSRQRA